ncbi:hypothetical protein NC652_025297 [Populus alba x Populus x berolinensis]|nr:hypothetical protein NC652_025297 [Populus alba x Populus x berolinensis]
MVAPAKLPMDGTLVPMYISTWGLPCHSLIYYGTETLRIPKKKSFKHGTWIIVTKTRLPHHREPNEFVFGPTFW